MKGQGKGGALTCWRQSPGSWTRGSQASIACLLSEEQGQSAASHCDPGLGPREDQMFLS